MSRLDLAPETNRLVPEARAALLSSFRELVLSRRYSDFGVNCVIRAAQVARSTFYYHFSGKDELLLENLQPFVRTLAAMVLDEKETAELEEWVAHVWQHRATACRLLNGRSGEKIRAMLVDHIRGNLEIGRFHPQNAVPIMAEQIAGAILAILRGWVEHRFAASREAVLQSLRHGASALAGNAESVK